MRNVKITISALALTLILQGCATHSYKQDRFARAYTGPVSIGTTFSQVQCEYLGLDWKDTYKETLEMNFNVIRLGAYWSRIEKEQGVFDFSELDWQLAGARDKDRKILLVVGMKAPRWPEYHIPQWLYEKIRSRHGIDISKNRLIKKHALEFVKQVMTRYNGNSDIIAWQVENEPFNRSGPNAWWISEDFLKEEIKIVRESDSQNRPVITNILSAPNKFLGFFSRFLYVENPIIKTIDFAEIPALNIYPVVGHKIWNFKMCFVTQPQERIDYVRDLVFYAESKHKKLWVTELQAEPWEPGHLVYKGDKSITCWPESFTVAFGELKSIGINEIFFWGVEYWFFRAKKYDDITWINAASSLLKD